MDGNGFAEVSRRYDLLNDLVSLGLHRRWKQELARSVLLARRGGAPILDIATGTGEVADRLAAVQGDPRGIIGVDPCREMLREGRRKGRRAEAWIEASAEQLPFRDASVAAITCAFGVRNFRDRARAFREWKRVLEPGGIVGIIEIHPPPGRGWLRPLIAFHWRRVVPALGALFGRGEAYRYLRDSAAAFISQPSLVAELEEVGFARRRVTSLFGHGMVSFTLVEKP